MLATGNIKLARSIWGSPRTRRGVDRSTRI